MYTSKFKNFLMPNKENKSYEEFYNFFVSKIKIKGHIFREGVFDDLLTDLYEMDNDLYKSWLKSFTSVDYGFVKKNLEYILPFLDQGEYLKFDKLYSIFCRKNSILARHISVIKKIETENIPKNVLIETLNDILISIDNNESELVNNIKEEYALMFEEETEPILKCFYYKNLNEIDMDVKDYITKRISAIEFKQEMENDNYFISNNFRKQPKVNMKAFLK